MRCNQVLITCCLLETNRIFSAILILYFILIQYSIWAFLAQKNNPQSTNKYYFYCALVNRHTIKLNVVIISGDCKVAVVQIVRLVWCSC